MTSLQLNRENKPKRELTLQLPLLPSPRTPTLQERKLSWCQINSPKNTSPPASACQELPVSGDARARWRGPSSSPCATCARERGEAEPEAAGGDSRADSVTRAAGLGPAGNHPTASRKKDPRESRGGIWSLDRLQRYGTCPVNINSRREIARSVGREARAQFCPVPHRSSLFRGTAPAARFGIAFSLPAHHDREGCDPCFLGHAGDLCSSLHPFILFSTQRCAADAWPQTCQLLSAFPDTAAGAQWHQQPVLADSPALSHSERSRARHYKQRPGCHLETTLPAPQVTRSWLGKVAGHFSAV